MTDQPRYTIALPAFLEEENLRVLLPRLVAATERLDAPAEILVVDSVTPRDATEQVCAAHGARFVRRGPSDVYGDAVRTAIEEARGDWLLFMDADGSHTPEFIVKMVEASSEADVVVASRYVQGGYSENSRTLALMSRALNLSYSLVLDLRCADASTSFKLYRTADLRSLALGSENFDIIEEMLYKLRRANRDLRIRELPYTFKRRMFGQTKRRLLPFVLGYAYTIVRLRLSATRWAAMRNRRLARRR